MSKLATESVQLDASDHEKTAGAVHLDAPETGFSFSRLVGLALATLILGVGVGMFVQRARTDASVKSAAGSPPNEVDVGFLRDMMTHHEQAIELSLIVLTNGDDASVRQEAVDVILGQRGEYVQMQDQLGKWGIDPIQPDGKAMGWMGMAVPEAKMPGLASPGEIAALRRLTGRSADVEFLRLMVAHHASGVEMATFASKRSQVPFVGALADQMVAVQAVEIAEMRAFARRLGTEIPQPTGHSDGASHSETPAPEATNPDQVDHSNHS
jgi:uncharacterized protein (DUF305 family)